MNAPRQAIIYLLRCPGDPSLEYVGVSTLAPLERLYRHRSRALHEGRNSKLYTAMRLHGVKSFTIETLEKISHSEAHNAERSHILARNAHVSGLNMRVPRLWPLNLRGQTLEPSLDAGLGALVPCTHGSTP